MKNMRKVLTMLLVLCIAVGVLPTTVQAKSKVSVKKEIILKQDGIIIKSDSLKDLKNAYRLTMIIQNKSEHDYSICAHSYSVNGLFCDANLYGANSVDVAKGKKARLYIDVDKAWMKENNISNISDFSIIFWGYHDSWAYLKSDPVQLKTNMYKKSRQFKPLGEQIYTDDNCVLYYEGKEKNSFAFTLYNKSEQDEYTVENFSANGWTCSLTDYTYDLYDEPMLPNSYVKFTIDVPEEFLKENGIKKIKDIEFNLNFGYDDKFNDIVTDKIVIK